LAILPDVLAHDLDILFCGTAAGSVSAKQGAYYAGPGNAFWPTLFAVGLTPVLLRPPDFAQIIEWNMGFTDLAKTVSGSDDELASDHFDVSRLHTVVADYRPRIIAFTSKRAAVEFLGRRVDYGLLADAGPTRLFVLPSPSGAARRYWSLDHWRDLSSLRFAIRPGRQAGRRAVATGSIAPPLRAPVAQLDRVFASEAVKQRFESDG
jgi:TDG/mug DNA glycosylase family protein